MTASTTDLYPAPMQSFHGRSVWPIGEEGDSGTLVEGHGRRAYAAYSAFLRDTLGRDHGDVTARDAKQVWVVLHETCGCTEEQHRTDHRDPRDGGYDCECERYGLPPCTPDVFAWTYDTVPEGTPGALPMLEVRW